jgi:hypothetical protein
VVQRTLDMILVYFNPQGFETRKRLFLQTVGEMHAHAQQLWSAGSPHLLRVLAVELAFDDTPFVLSPRGDVIQLRTWRSAVLWPVRAPHDAGVACRPFELCAGACSCCLRRMLFFAEGEPNQHRAALPSPAARAVHCVG